MFRPNDQIGPYTLIRPLGAGSFGEVWLAERRSQLATIQVAVKFPHSLSEDGEDFDAALARQRDIVAKEAEIWTKASGHPNVLPLLDADIYDGNLAIVSEYAPDGSLSKWLNVNGGKAPSLESAVEMMKGILSGLEHLHKRGIVHRDLKPGNILLQGDVPRLTDFGISRLLDATPTRSLVSGTFAYMPPEAFQGIRSERTDVWSAGVLLYRMLAGRLPYPEKDQLALMHAIQNYVPVALPETVPPALQAVVAKSLEKDAANRFQSAAEMRSAIQRAIPVQDEKKEEKLEQEEQSTIDAVNKEKIKHFFDKNEDKQRNGSSGTADFNVKPIFIALGAIAIPLFLVILILSANSDACKAIRIEGSNDNPNRNSNYNGNYNANDNSNRNSNYNSNGNFNDNSNLNSNGNSNSTPTLYDVPELQGKVTALKFFEGGTETPKPGSRSYSVTFLASLTRYVHAEFELAYPASIYERTYFVEVEWYKNGTLIKKDNSSASRVQPGWTGSHSVYYIGSSTYGSLGAGNYEIFFRSKDGRIIANRKFVIISGASNSNSNRFNLNGK